MVLYLARRLATFAVSSVASLFLSIGSNFSLASLLSALWIAFWFVLLKRDAAKKPVKYRVLVRALFPKWLRRASFKADVWFLLLNVFAMGLLIGWTAVSSKYISDNVARSLAHTFGVLPKPGLNDFVSRSIVTVCLFLAYELAFWIDHYLSHRVAVLWEFHKVHHTAEVLSPITNFRVHPIDSVVFFNILRIFLGTTGGVLSYFQLGDAFTVGGANAILVAFIFLTVHLQHSHVWIAATGPMGRVILSPAHHQIHHSDNPIHFDKNFGACLSIWDWLFGTLHVPERKRERLNFGIPAQIPGHHTAMGGLVTPFVKAWERLRPAIVPETPLASARDQSISSSPPA
jgi:sterol desaturase/sphingolipid hydroxylase (fatty acid hydroxylase superfamily)